MRLPRMTTRRWMIAVAITALVLGVGAEVIRESRLASHYRRLADLYRYGEELNKGVPAAHPSGVGTIQIGTSFPKGAAYYEEMRRRYERAARYPWLPIGADPPEPGGIMQVGSMR